MAFALSDVQSNVQLMTRHDGLADQVKTWTNRVIQDICTRAYWMRNTGLGYFESAYSPINGSQSTPPVVNMITSNPAFGEMINMVEADYGVLTGAGTTLAIQYRKSNLRRVDLRDLYMGADGCSSSTTADYVSTVVERYAVAPFWTSATHTNSYREPGVLMFPQPLSGNAQLTTGGCVAALYLGALPKLTTSTSTNWILEKYFKVVLAGVMRYVRLFLGDSQGYLLERSEYENGLRDMLLHEEAPTALTPVMRGVGNEYMGRAQG
jgi:hypothetical protein